MSLELDRLEEEAKKAISAVHASDETLEDRKDSLEELWGDLSAMIEAVDADIERRDAAEKQAIDNDDSSDDKDEVDEEDDKD
jgi:hypothetical protein